MKRWLAILSVAASAAGCSDNGQAPGGNDGGRDQSMTSGDDLSMGGNNEGGAGPADLATVTSCTPDPGDDGQACGNGCPSGSNEIGFTDQTGMCHCWKQCNPNNPADPTCYCGHVCQPVYAPTGDGGFQIFGAGCVPTNGPGERCGADANQKLYGWGICPLSTFCITQGTGAGDSYCEYKCNDQTDCPSGTTCIPVHNGAGMSIGNACLLNMTSAQNGGKAAGAACAPTDACVTGTMCDGTCKPVCGGPWDQSCTGGTHCTALLDSGDQKIAGYVCK
jgi:hypothetical protein